MVTIRKPKQNRAINTFESIVSAGFISVMKNGLDHTTVLKVCEIAGVGSGSFMSTLKIKKHCSSILLQKFQKLFMA